MALAPFEIQGARPWGQKEKRPGEASFGEYFFGGRDQPFSSTRRILPEMVLGRSSRNSTMRGYL